MTGQDLEQIGMSESQVGKEVLLCQTDGVYVPAKYYIIKLTFLQTKKKFLILTCQQVL
jgi:hypothetical protein